MHKNTNGLMSFAVWSSLVALAYCSIFFMLLHVADMIILVTGVDKDCKICEHKHTLWLYRV